MTVIRPLARAEYDHSVEHGKNTRHALFGLCIPELEVSAMRFFPRAIQINKHVDAGVQGQAIVPACIDMHVQKAAGICLMTTAIVWIGHYAGRIP